MTTTADIAPTETTADAEYVIEPAAAVDEPEHDALKEPRTPAEAADKAERILAILVEAKGGSRRESQVAMAREVASSLFGKRPLLVEGPTGTGKSLAYLAGALATGMQTVVATHTKALQDQLILDLQALMGALEASTELWAGAVPTYALMKGRANYACLNKVSPPEGGPDAAPELDLDPGATFSPTTPIGQEVKKLNDWIKTTPTGDRTDVPFEVGNQAWGAVSTSADGCGGKSCKFYEECFAETARAKAAASTIIIANQALLAMSMQIPVLPDVEAIIVDEAHEFPAVVSSTFGAEVTIKKFESAIESGKALDAVSASTATAKRDAATAAVASVKRAIAIPKKFEYNRAAFRDAPARKALEKLRSAFFDLRELAQAFPIRSEKDTAKRDILKRRYGNLMRDIDILLLGQTDTQVAWAERGGYDQLVMKSAMFDVSGILEERLIREYKAVTFTSATLRLAGSFDHMRQELGLSGPNIPVQEMAVPSPFNLREQGRVWFPLGLPLPNDPTFPIELVNKAVIPAARMAGGRTQVLATSTASVATMAAELRRLVGDEFEIIEQVPGATFKVLAKRFLDNPQSILVGTRTFWTGVSFEGFSSICVVVEKAPFPSKGDPIVGAKSDAVDARGGSSFREVFLPPAIRLKEQGEGRAIRTRADLALIVHGDVRINPNDSRRKQYARDFNKAMEFTEVDERGAMAWLDHIRQLAEAELEAEAARAEGDDGPMALGAAA